MREYIVGLVLKPNLSSLTPKNISHAALFKGAN